MEFGLSIAFHPLENYVPLAQAAEENGFSAVSLADHLIYPGSFSVPYPYTPDGVPRFGEFDSFPDPWVAITAMAAQTRVIQFYTNVFVLPTRNPVQVAKILATADLFSNERVGLGIGMGWMPEEFAAAGQPFAARGKRADEMIDILRLLWSGEQVSYEGEHYTLDAMRQVPPPRRQIPIYVGGFSAPALRRAAHNDGWIADLHSLSELQGLIENLDEHRAKAGTADRADYRIMAFGCTDAYEPAGFKAMADMGVTVATTMPWVLHGHSMTPPLQVAIDSIKRFADEVISKVQVEATPAGK
ncbi:TIGR03619 family F420-dependent LLM class oxidoreductase [Parahaliea aestuarii]|uniref:TIGR03619 family F420-dependent LLM class oxidoreductase n=1 Tax=Parahaliea aestuarii TaxID=1852021 RepID=A0A5C8ZWF4_9GAMM|nr:TIGR03619 family F420-dependent LLM class oxidoreductase [Parahaliea aestuarii]TXS91797.1 TIGR03619 family F420-dependent LLM class oxidoreductase [Parahaliea aestuarii]